MQTPVLSQMQPTPPTLEAQMTLATKRLHFLATSSEVQSSTIVHTYLDIIKDTDKDNNKSVRKVLVKLNIIKPIQMKHWNLAYEVLKRIYFYE